MKPHLILRFFPFGITVYGIDIVAGGKSKKTKWTAPKPDDIYLKLLVKVRATQRWLASSLPVGFL